MSKPRLVIMANNIDEVGGAQRVAHVLAQGLALRGYRVDLVGVAPFVPRHEFIHDPAYRESVLMSQPWPAPPRGQGLRARLRPGNREVRARRERLGAEAAASLADLLNEGQPGIIITTQLWAMEQVARVPHDSWAVIGQYHSSFEAAAAGRDLRRARQLYADVDAFTLLTAEDAAAFSKAGLNNTTWVANPLAFWPAAPVEGHRAGTVTYLGRLSREKGVRYLIEAWGLVADRHPDWRLRLVGNGPDDAAVRAAVAALPSGADRVDIRPPVSDAEAELRESDLLVLPSLTEGLPLVLAEAMSLGLPCIATDCSAGVRMLAAEGVAARLVARGDAVELGEAMSDLMSSSAERRALGERARAAMDPYRLDVILDRWDRLIDDVLR